MARVLLLHEYPGGFGGAERYLEVLASGLVARGIEVAAVVFAGSPADASGFVDRLRSAGAAPVSLHRFRSRPLPIARAVRRFRPDVLHWNGTDPFAFRGGLMTLLPWRRSSVLTDHLPMLRTGPHWETTRRLVNRVLPAVVVVGRAGEEAAREHWRRPPRLRVVANGVRTGHGRLRTAADADPLHLVLVGRLTAQKNPLFVFDVVSALVDRGIDCRLTVVGDGDLRHEVDARAADDDRVRCLGFVDDPTPALLEASVFVAPSRFEGLPFTPLEALAAGCPLVLSDIPPHAEIARTAGAASRLVATGDAGAWAEALVAVRDDLPAASAAALDAAEQFSMGRMVDQTVRLYGEVVA